jgi:DNA-binding XRE family transcriptional regulator
MSRHGSFVNPTYHINLSGSRTIRVFLFAYWFVAATTNLRKVLGETIRTQREAADLSQEKLAELADLSRNYIGELERGETNVSIEALARVAKALRVRVRDLVTDI